MSFSHNRTLPFTLFIGAVLFFASNAHAESTMWNTTINGAVAVCISGPGCAHVGPGFQGGYTYTLGFNDPNITVQYRAFVKNADTGEIIPPGGSVPVDTKLQLAFDQHQTQDIYWFATGGYLDSPYGDWGEPTTPPPTQCLAKDFVETNPDPTGAPVSYAGYASFVVRPPTQDISGVDSSILNCGTSDGFTQSCTATQTGTLPLVFNFAPTQGKMYGRFVSFTGSFDTGQDAPANECVGSNSPMFVRSGARWNPSANSMGNLFMQPGSDTDTINVGQESISYPITIVAAGNPPSAPSLSSGTSCLLGTPTTITMTSTSPDNNQLKYGIDWNGDGTVDEWVPGSGFVPSGTAQTASRTYSTEGTKTVKVLAQDANGLDSAWSSTTFTCSAPQNNNQNNGDGSSGNSSFNGNNNGNDNGNNTNPSADLRLTVPSLVARNSTAQISWTADNVTSCQPVTGDNGDSFLEVPQSNTSFASPVGGDTSAPITTRTVYTLTCTDLNGQTQTKTAAVNIQPTFQEK